MYFSRQRFHFDMSMIDIFTYSSSVSFGGDRHCQTPTRASCGIWKYGFIRFLFNSGKYFLGNIYFRRKKYIYISVFWESKTKGPSMTFLYKIFAWSSNPVSILVDAVFLLYFLSPCMEAKMWLGGQERCSI